MSQPLTEPEWIFPFEDMNVGDSFFIPTLRPVEMLYVIDTRSKVAGVKIKAYPSSKDKSLGVRVWRIA
jgi:ethanolamine utilization microcompartment shell protein EutL